MNVLIKAGADVNAEFAGGGIALMLAAKNGYEKCVKMLIEARADVNRNNSHISRYAGTSCNTPLLCAAMYHQYNSMEVLIKAEAKRHFSN